MNRNLVQRIQELGRRFLLAAGRRCAVCGSRTQADDPVFTAVCTACLKELQPRIDGYCPQCGLLYASPNDHVYLCASCRRSPRPWSLLGFFSPYAGLVRTMITDFKFRARLPLVTVLGTMLQQGFALHEMETSDVLIPVPLHPKRLQERGFNQSLEMARPLVPSLAPILDTRSLIRVRNTQAQRGLDRKARQSNLKGAFAVRGQALVNKHVLLVDDVMTTGSTLAACAGALRKGGVRRVDVLVVARA